MQLSSLPINSLLQNNPRYQFSLKAENIEILTILSVAIFKMAAIGEHIQGYFYEPTIFKMAANKIVKLSKISDFNEN
jgi:hypothetical protein